MLELLPVPAGLEVYNISFLASHCVINILLGKRINKFYMELF